MKAEVVAVGSELLLGEIVDTNSAFLAGELADLGIDLYYISQVGDNLLRCSEVISRALSRSDLVIVTGGLGPTDDDLTREAIATALGEELVVDPDVLAGIETYFKMRGLEMPSSNVKQAMRIPSADFLPNRVGTAPGWWVQKDGRILVAMPGVPSEMRVMWQEHVRPRLEGLSGMVIVRRILKCFGIGESTLEAMVKDLVTSSNPTVATYAKRDGVHLRIAAKATTLDEAWKLVHPVEDEMRRRLGDFVYGTDDETLPGVLGKLLLSRGWALAVAESCTGGEVAALLTDVPGASRYFVGGVVAYTGQAKELLGVPREVIARHGLVSSEVAICLAEAARRYFSADAAVGVTGVAGPEPHGGAEPGTFYVGIDVRGDVASQRFFRPLERTSFKYFAAMSALNFMRLKLIALGEG